MWGTFAFAGVTVLCDRHGRIIAYARGAPGARLQAMVTRLNQRHVAA